MRRLLLLGLAAAAAALAVAACSSPPNQPCVWHNGVRYAHLSNDGGGTGGQTLLVVCKDGTIKVTHP